MPLPQIDDLLEKGMKAFTAFLEGKVTLLAGRTVVGQADQEVAVGPPWIAVRPKFQKTTTFLGADDEVDVTKAKADPENTPGQITVCVGEWDGTVELMLCVGTPAERAYYTSAILQAILGDDAEEDADRHGIVVLDLGTVALVGGTPNYQPTASFALVDEGWQEEKAFTRDRRMVLELDASIPLLVNRAVLGTMDTITLGNAWQPGEAQATEADEDFTG